MRLKRRATSASVAAPEFVACQAMQARASACRRARLDEASTSSDNWYSMHTRTTSSSKVEGLAGGGGLLECISKKPSLPIILRSRSQPLSKKSVSLCPCSSQINDANCALATAGLSANCESTKDVDSQGTLSQPR